MTKQRSMPLAESLSAKSPPPPPPFRSASASVSERSPLARSGPTAEASKAAGVARASASDHLVRKQCPRCGERYPADFLVCPRDTAILHEVTQAADPLVGKVLADTYDVLGVVGEGAMGRVYEARHTRLGSKRFAIKVLHGELTRQSDVVSRFLREAEATSALDHPNIVGVLDVNQLEDGRPYLVAELLQGDQLGHYLERRRRLEVPEAIHICRQVCQALIAAHDKAIVHRDIKPGNVFLVGEGDNRLVKVLDFGISRIGDTSADLTKTGMVMGTPAYMPPEQARGARVDHRADIYAVGSILYEAVTGARAFADTDQVATLAAVLTLDPVRPCILNPQLPPALELVIQKAMAKDPEERYRTMRELDAALAEFDGTHAHSGLPRQEVFTERVSHVSLPNIELPERLARFVGQRSIQLDNTRAALCWYSCALALVSTLGLIDASTGLVRLSSAGAPITATEIVLCTLGSAGLLVTPAVLWGRHVVQRVWPSTPRVLDTLRRVRRVLFVALATYAAGTLLVRVLDGAFHVDPSGAAWAGWGVLVFLAAVVAGARCAWRQARALSG